MKSIIQKDFELLQELKISYQNISEVIELNELKMGMNSYSRTKIQKKILIRIFVHILEKT